MTASCDRNWWNKRNNNNAIYLKETNIQYPILQSLRDSGFGVTARVAYIRCSKHVRNWNLTARREQTTVAKKGTAVAAIVWIHTNTLSVCQGTAIQTKKNTFYWPMNAGVKNCVSEWRQNWSQDLNRIANGNDDDDNDFIGWVSTYIIFYSKRNKQTLLVQSVHHNCSYVTPWRVSVQSVHHNCSYVTPWRISVQSVHHSCNYVPPWHTHTSVQSVH